MDLTYHQEWFLSHYNLGRFFDDLVLEGHSPYCKAYGASLGRSKYISIPFGVVPIPPALYPNNEGRWAIAFPLIYPDAGNNFSSKKQALLSVAREICLDCPFRHETLKEPRTSLMIERFWTKNMQTSREVHDLSRCSGLNMDGVVPCVPYLGRISLNQSFIDAITGGSTKRRIVQPVLVATILANFHTILGPVLDLETDPPPEISFNITAPVFPLGLEQV